MWHIKWKLLENSIQICQLNDHLTPYLTVSSWKWPKNCIFNCFIDVISQNWMTYKAEFWHGQWFWAILSKIAGGRLGWGQTSNPKYLKKFASWIPPWTPRRKGDLVRVAPDTDLAGYPANLFAGYPAINPLKKISIHPSKCRHLTIKVSIFKQMGV